MENATQQTKPRKPRIPTLTIPTNEALGAELLSEINGFNSAAREWGERELELAQKTAAVTADASGATTEDLSRLSGEVRSLRLKQAQQKVSLLDRRRSLVRTLVYREWLRLKRAGVAAKKQAIETATAQLEESGVGVAAQVKLGLSRDRAVDRVRQMATEMLVYREAEGTQSSLKCYFENLSEENVRPQRIAGHPTAAKIDQDLAVAHAELQKIVKLEAGL